MKGAEPLISLAGLFKGDYDSERFPGCWNGPGFVKPFLQIKIEWSNGHPVESLLLMGGS